MAVSETLRPKGPAQHARTGCRSVSDTAIGLNAKCARRYAASVWKLVVVLTLCTVGLHSEVRPEDLCRVLSRPKDFAGKLITIRASARPTIHGTYLNQPECGGSILVVLPEEIAGYRGSVHPVKD